MILETEVTDDYVGDASRDGLIAPPTCQNLGKVASPEEDAAVRQRKGFPEALSAQPEEARAVPGRAGDGARNGGEACVGRLTPDVADDAQIHPKRYA